MLSFSFDMISCLKVTKTQNDLLKLFFAVIVCVVLFM